MLLVVLFVCLVEVQLGCGEALIETGADEHRRVPLHVGFGRPDEGDGAADLHKRTDRYLGEVAAAVQNHHLLRLYEVGCVALPIESAH